MPVWSHSYTVHLTCRMRGWPAAPMFIALADTAMTTTVMRTTIAGPGEDWTTVTVPFTATASGTAAPTLGLYVSLPVTAPTGQDGIFEIARWAVYAGDYDGDYWDGDTTDSVTRGYYTWTGSPHASTSQRYLAQIQGRSSISCTWQPRRWLVI